MFKSFAVFQQPASIAVDGFGNVYIDDGSIKEWIAASNTLTILATNGRDGSGHTGVAVDAAGNVYFPYHTSVPLIAALDEWVASNSNVITLTSNFATQTLAVDWAGDVYSSRQISQGGGCWIQEWIRANGNLTTLPGIPMWTAGLAISSSGNLFYSEGDLPLSIWINELVHAFVDTTAKSEGPSPGTDVVPILPVPSGLLGSLAPTTDQSWLTFNGMTAGGVSFAFTANNGMSNRVAHINVLGQSVSVTQGTGDYLAATNLLEGPAAGVDSIVLVVNPPTGAWTAAANDPWLHLSLANQSGAGSTNVIFSFDANPGPTRTGTLTIAGQPLTITQAGSTYVAAPVPVTTLVSSFPQGSTPVSMAADSSGNVYYVVGYGAIVKWTAENNNVSIIVPNGQASSAAVDFAGNLYFTSYQGPSVCKWTAWNNTSNIVTSQPVAFGHGLAVDEEGNIFYGNIHAAGMGFLQEWVMSNSNVTTLGSYGYFVEPSGIATDAAGNAYFTINNTINEWTPANNNITTLISNGLSNPYSAAVDASGNVYIGDIGDHSIKEWVAGSGNLIQLATGSYPYSVAVDAARNVYIGYDDSNSICELPRAFLDPTAKLESAAAGSDSLPVVLPATENLGPPFTPTSDQPWLTISGTTNGVVSFSFAANTTTSNRTGHITLLGESIPVTQTAFPALIGASMLGNSVLQFAISNVNQNTSFTVLFSADVSLPLSNWTVIGMASNVAPGLFQFTDTNAADAQRYYTVRSP